MNWLSSVDAPAEIIRGGPPPTSSARRALSCVEHCRQTFSMEDTRRQHHVDLLRGDPLLCTIVLYSLVQQCGCEGAASFTAPSCLATSTIDARSSCYRVRNRARSFACPSNRTPVHAPVRPIAHPHAPACLPTRPPVPACLPSYLLATCTLPACKLICGSKSRGRCSCPGLRCLRNDPR